MYKSKKKGPDRIIFYELGIILALLSFNYVMGLSYTSTSGLDVEPPIPNDPFEVTFVVPVQEPKTKQPKQKPEKVEVKKFDLTQKIKLVSDLFKKKEAVSLPKLPGPIAPIKIAVPIADTFLPNKIDVFPDVMPEFPGGEEAFYAWFRENLEYPEALLDMGLSANVVTQFVIDQDGNVNDIKILDNTRPGFGVEYEVRKTLGRMPKWTPGKTADRNVKCRLILPINLQSN
jgi:protein TonB